jgi:hypothetical protein
MCLKQFDDGSLHLRCGRMHFWWWRKWDSTNWYIDSRGHLNAGPLELFWEGR